MICVIAWRNRGTFFLTTYKWGMANNCIIVLHWNDMCLKIRIIPACCCVSTAKWKCLCLVLWISGDIKTTTLVNCLVFPNTQDERNYWTFLCCIDVDSLCCRTIPFKDVVQMKIQFYFSSVTFSSDCAMREKMWSWLVLASVPGSIY